MRPTGCIRLSRSYVDARLLRRLAQYHHLETIRQQSVANASVAFTSRPDVKDEGECLRNAEEYSQNVLRWFSDAVACGDHVSSSRVVNPPQRRLLQMVKEYTELHNPIAYILGQFRHSSMTHRPVS